MREIESKLKELNQMLIQDGYNERDIVIQTLKEIRKEAINYTPSCTNKDLGKHPVEGVNETK